MKANRTAIPGTGRPKGGSHKGMRYKASGGILGGEPKQIDRKLKAKELSERRRTRGEES